MKKDIKIIVIGPGEMPEQRIIEMMKEMESHGHSVVITDHIPGIPQTPQFPKLNPNDFMKPKKINLIPEKGSKFHK